MANIEIKLIDGTLLYTKNGRDALRTEINAGHSRGSCQGIAYLDKACTQKVYFLFENIAYYKEI